MKTTLYSVWIIDESGDIFKGYNPVFVSDHLNSNAADIIRDRNSGSYIEVTTENCHPDYIASLEKNDKAIIDDYNRVINSTREMLTHGG